MTEDTAQICLILPAELDTDTLKACLDATEIACLRLLPAKDEEHTRRAADRLRAEAHARDIPLIIHDLFPLAQSLGLDGVHLNNGHTHYREARKALGEDAIIGVYSGQSRHSGITAAEMGAEYVSFGPITPHEMDLSETAPQELFAWWSEMIEVPVVAEGRLTLEATRSLAPSTDFIALGAEIWEGSAASGETPQEALRRYAAAILS